MSDSDALPVRPQPDPRWMVPALLVLFAAAAAHSLFGESATFDETAHLPAGYTYLDRGDLRLNPEHPPLTKAWAALPLWLFGDVNPDYASTAWTGRPVGPDGQRSKASEWMFGYELMNGKVADPIRSDPWRMLIPARLAMIIPGLLLGLVVYAWSRELWGARPAMLSLFLFSLSPTMLAHTRLVTTDLPNAFGFVLTIWTLWRFCIHPGRRRALAYGGALGLSLLIKFSALLLLPISLLMLGIWVVGRRAAGRPGRLRWAGAALLAWLPAYGLVWIGYGLRFAASTDPGYALDWDVVGLRSGPIYALVEWALNWRLAPEGYLYGLAYFLGGAARRLAYLNGQQSLIGWWYYFPEAFLLKTPPTTLLLSATLLSLAAWKRRLATLRGLFLIVPALVYVAVSVVSNLNIGHRHLTPIYPLLFVGLGSLPLLLPPGRRGRILLSAVLVAYGWSFVVATPGYLGYFNGLAGGSAGGARYLLDSNLDWGQDLPRLAARLERDGIDRVRLAYFGTADPAAYGIRFDKLLLVHDFHPELEAGMPLSGEWVAVSANLLHGLYFDHERALAEALVGRTALDPASIREWLDLRDRLSLSGRRHPPLRIWLLEEGLVSPQILERVEAGLLSSWFRRLRNELQPVARIGDSILLYRIP